MTKKLKCNSDLHDIRNSGIKEPNISQLFENQIAGGANRESLLTKENLAAYLRVSIRTIDTWVCRNKVPYIKVGRIVRFDKKVIDRWLEEKSNGH